MHSIHNYSAFRAWVLISVYILCNTSMALFNDSETSTIPIHQSLLGTRGDERDEREEVFFFLSLGDDSHMSSKWADCSAILSEKQGDAWKPIMQMLPPLGEANSFSGLVHGITYNISLISCGVPFQPPSLIFAPYSSFSSPSSKVVSAGEFSFASQATSSVPSSLEQPAPSNMLHSTQQHQETEISSMWSSEMPDISILFVTILFSLIGLVVILLSATKRSPFSSSPSFSSIKLNPVQSNSVTITNAAKSKTALTFNVSVTNNTNNHTTNNLQKRTSGTIPLHSSSTKPNVAALASRFKGGQTASSLLAQQQEKLSSLQSVSASASGKYSLPSPSTSLSMGTSQDPASSSASTTTTTTATKTHSAPLEKVGKLSTVHQDSNPTQDEEIAVLKRAPTAEATVTSIVSGENRNDDDSDDDDDDDDEVEDLEDDLEEFFPSAMTALAHPLLPKSSQAAYSLIRNNDAADKDMSVSGGFMIAGNRLWSHGAPSENKKKMSLVSSHPDSTNTTISSSSDPNASTAGVSEAAPLPIATAASPFAHLLSSKAVSLSSKQSRKRGKQYEKFLTSTTSSSSSALTDANPPKDPEKSPTIPSPKPTTVCDVDISRFEKMLRMGVPEGAVHQQMRKEGIDPSLLSSTATTAAGRAISSSAPPSVSKPTPPPSSSSSSSLLVPPMHHHQQPSSTEQVSTHISIPAILGSTTTNASNKVTGIAITTAISPTMRDIDSFFASSSKASATPPTTSVTSSSTSSSSSSATVPERSANNKGSRVALLDPKRSTNVAIALSKFRGVPYAMIARVLSTLQLVGSGSSKEGYLSKEQLFLLPSIVPTQSEINIITSWFSRNSSNLTSISSSSTLAEAESFMHAVSAIPQLAERAAALAFCAGYEEQVQSLHDRASLLAKCASEVCKSMKLQQIVQIANEVVINKGVTIALGSSGGGNAGQKSVSLSTLPILKTARLPGASSSNPRATLLHYLAAVLMKMDRYLTGASIGSSSHSPKSQQLSQQFRMMFFRTEIPSVERAVAASFDFSTLQQEMFALSKGINSMIKLLEMPNASTDRMQQSFEELSCVMSGSLQELQQVTALYPQENMKVLNNVNTLLRSIVEFVTSLGKAMSEVAEM